MIRIITLIAILTILGCSSEKKKNKFEAAENSSTDSEKKKVPDWMKSRSKEDSDQKSVTTKGSSSNELKKPENGVGIAANNKGNNDPGKKSGAPNDKKKSQVANSKSGEATALMAQLTEKYQASLKYAQESTAKNLSPEEQIKVREQYAKLVEEWLAIADKILEMKLRIEDRRFVVAIKKQAHENLQGLNRPEHEEKLYAFAETLKDETDTEIKKLYQFIMIRKPLTKILRKEEVDEKAFFDQFEKFVSFYRDDQAVYRSAEAWLNQMYLVNRDYYAKALEIAQKHFSQSTDTQIMSLSESMADRLMAIKIGFDVAISDVMEEKPDAPKNLLETVKRLLAQPNLSTNSLLQVVRAGHQLESVGEYEIAKQYFEELGKISDKYDNAQAKELIRFHVGAALTRNKLLGKPLQVVGMIPRIESNQFLQKPIDYSAYKGKVVILFFWAVANRQDYMVVDELDRFFAANTDKDLAMIGINVDRRMDIVSGVMKHELSVRNRKWTHLMPTTPKVMGINSAMAKKCGLDFLPFNVIIDKEGNVDSYRIFGPRLEETVSRLLGEPVKKVYLDPNKPLTKKDDAKKDDAKKDDAKKDDAKKEDAKKEDAKKEDAKKDDSSK